MECPRTGAPMLEKTIGKIKVDISTGCGAIWFDHLEIKKFDELSEAGGEELISAAGEYHKDINTTPRLRCPQCADVIMLRHFFSVSRQVEIDECPGCGGIWLDPGEIKAIRELFEDSEKKGAAADRYFESLFSSPEMKAMKAGSPRDLQRAKRLARMFKYICPSSYLPGKQDWGSILR